MRAQTAGSRQEWLTARLNVLEARDAGEQRTARAIGMVLIGQVARCERKFAP